jgi:hypothetical protein
MSIDTVSMIETWRAQAIRTRQVADSVCTPGGDLLNYHARVVARPAAEVYGRLARMGSPLDDLWPLASMPMKVEGALAPGVAAAHGPIRYALAAIDDGRRIEWRFTMANLHGRYEYTVSPVDDGALVENVIDGFVTAELVEVWPEAVGAFHDWVIERIFDRLAEPPAPWFDPAKAVFIR